jgi:hypothetical protein
VVLVLEVCDIIGAEARQDTRDNTKLVCRLFAHALTTGRYWSARRGLEKEETRTSPTFEPYELRNGWR